MTEAARKILDAIDLLVPKERAEVLNELLRRAAFSPHEFPDDADLLMSADQVFLQYDQRENQQ